MRYIANSVKEYPDMFRVVVYREPIMVEDTSGTRKRKKSEVTDDYEPSVSSLRRTRTLIRDLILSNDFDLFATFTFDPGKVRDRFSYASCYGKLQRWIHNQHEKSPDLIYLFIPEQHKSGAWHFHALLGHYNGTMRKTNHKTPYGADIYNITAYRGGFTTACYFDDKDRVTGYLLKYITKDFIKSFNQRRFFASKNLRRPIKRNNAILDFSLPHKTIYENDYYQMFEF